ncbi:MAG: magnesium transporter MgtE [Methanomicrobiales archaeon]|nr:magnesium transporter MgtE [Methanomicrobiales archaeon]
MLKQVAVAGRWRLVMTGLVALVLSALAASVAGMYLGSVRDVLELIPGLMVLLPPSINMRGSISGVLASRLSSSMHLGEFEVAFEKTSVLGGNLRASLVVTVLIAFVLGLFAWGVTTLLGEHGIGITDFVLISVISGIISGIIVLAITILVAVASHRHGVDLDMIGAPTVTTSGDVVTLPILIVTALGLLSLDPGLRFGLFFIVLCAVGVSAVSVRYLTTEVREIVREIVPLLIPLSLLGTFAGATYALDLDRLISFAALLILIPPFMGGCGSIGGILCSRLATGMHTGVFYPHLRPEREVYPHFATTYLYAFVLLPLMAVVAHGAALVMGLSSPGLLAMGLIATGAGIIVLSLVNIVSYVTASMSFRYGLDPDNFGIPVITSIIDLLGAAILIGVINMVL